MNEDILDAVVEILKDPTQKQYHGSFVNYLVERDYVTATFHADEGNLAVMGSYIKWREWLIVDGQGHVTNDTRADFNG